MRRDPLPLNATIGIFGGGQLGRMLASAAAKLGFKTAIYAPEANSPASQVAYKTFRGAYDDVGLIEEFARSCGVVTFEFENVPAATLQAASRHAPVFPPVRAAEVAQDRMREKSFLSSAGIAVAPCAFIEKESDLAAANALLSSSPTAILKRAREGYDGKGQRLVKSEGELVEAFQALGGPCVLEAKVEFVAEVSVIAVRSIDGQTFSYDVPRNHHEGGILRESIVPSGCGDEVEREAKRIAKAIADALDYVGVIGVEFFVLDDGGVPKLLVNEIAPRVHNTGHWTLDACTISQFENHIRAIAGWPIGSTARHSNARMRNLLGSEICEAQAMLRETPSLSLYAYGKDENLPGRKVGHVTLLSPLVAM